MQTLFPCAGSGSGHDPPELNQVPPEPKRQKLDDQDDDGHHTNKNRENQVEGSGKTVDAAEETVYSDNDNFHAILALIDADTPSPPREPGLMWKIDDGDDSSEDDAERCPWVHCVICGKVRAHPTILCPYFDSYPEGGHVEPYAPVRLVSLFTGQDSDGKDGPRRVVFDDEKALKYYHMPFVSTRPPENKVG